MARRVATGSRSGPPAGERARFWHKAYENHYGFRVRTRDHTWIEGFLFIDHAEPVATESTLAVVGDSRASGSSLVRHGRMHLFACQTE